MKPHYYAMTTVELVAILSSAAFLGLYLGLRGLMMMGAL